MCIHDLTHADDARLKTITTRLKSGFQLFMTLWLWVKLAKHNVVLKIAAIFFSLLIDSRKPSVRAPGT